MFAHVLNMDKLYSLKMEIHREGTSIGRPPYFKGDNYAHSKVKLIYLLKMKSDRDLSSVQFD